jgi:hypothetical protein
MKKWVNTFVRLILLAITMSVASCGELIPEPPKPVPPSDAQLETIFREKRASFDKLVAMSNEDSKVVCIAYTFTWLEDNVAWPRSEDQLGFSQEKWSEYKALFDELSLKGGLDRGKSTIFLSAYAAGMVTGGNEKGYLYSKDKQENVLDSLDDFRPTPGKPFACKKLAENWYLYRLFD